MIARFAGEGPLAAWRLRARLALAAVLGATAAAGLAPTDVWFLTLAAMVTVPALMLAVRSPAEAAWTGWAFGVGYFAHALSWIVEPFLVDLVRHGWMAPFALVFSATGFALFWAFGFWLAARLGRSGPARVWLMIATLTLAGFARAYVLTGFPWAAPAQVWVGTPVSLLLAWVGPHGLTLLTLAASLPAGLALALRGGALRFVPAMIFALTVAGVAATRPGIEQTGAIVRLVQPNAAQHEKWQAENIPVFFDRQIAFTRAPGRNGIRPDLIVWPETAIPDVLDRAQGTFEVIAEAAQGSAVVLGLRRLEQARIFNSLVLLDPAGKVAGQYDKHHLVPFGEYMPLGDLAARFGLHGLAAGEGDGFSAGPGPRLLQVGALGLALPLICYEAVFAQDVGGVTGRPDFLLQITNDAWFGQNSGPYQHLAQAQMRAIEQGVPLLRSANTGVSAMIDPLGHVTHSLHLGVAGFIDAPLPAPLSPTLYSRTGDLPLFGLVLLSLLGFSALRPRVGPGK